MSQHHSNKKDVKPGAPKKDGGGGKGTWGKTGSEYGSSTRVDAQDPNYDSEDVCIPLLLLQGLGFSLRTYSQLPLLKDLGVR